jgi:excisionase family DNA binding protein
MTANPDVTFLKLAISRKQAADALSVDIQTVDRMIAASKLRASKLGRRVVIRVADIERMLDAN